MKIDEKLKVLRLKRLLRKTEILALDFGSHFGRGRPLNLGHTLNALGSALWEDNFVKTLGKLKLTY